LFLPLYARMIRTRLLETLGEPFVLTARAKGASELRILRRHVLKNALLPIMTMLAMDMGTALTAAIYVETVFGLSGLGLVACARSAARTVPSTCP
jgi:peptide/nickel transport system permease protein